jgi:outer membrane protein insertion porin family
VGLDLYHWRDDYIDYMKRTTGGVLRFAYPIGEYSSVGWGYRFDRYELYDLDDDASNIIRKYADGIRYSSVLLGRLTRDTTNREHPTSGNIDRIGVEYGGGFLAGDDDFFSVSLEHQTYYQLWPAHILHLRARGAAIFKNGSEEIPVFERFWMGGMDSVRGYDSRDIVPRDPETGDRIGGDRMAFANFEYIYSLNEELGFNIVPFFDIGFNLDTDEYTSISDELKKSVGLELRWRSPMGDLRFSYGFPLDETRRGDKESGRFEFAMGQFF